MAIFLEQSKKTMSIKMNKELKKIIRIGEFSWNFFRFETYFN